MTPTPKRLEELTLLDRFLFAEVMEEKENLQILLEIILGKDISLKEPAQTEKEIRRTTENRMVRLDVWTMDELQQVYDTEVQKRNTHNLPKRSRLYQGMIDSRLLPPGSVDFNKLNPVFIILISPFDLFGEGRYQYTFENRCIENVNLRLDDGATRIFLNTRGTNDHEVSPELVELLHYMENTNSENSLVSDDRLHILKKNVIRIQHDEERSIRYMQAWEEKVMDREEALAEGEAIGLQKGIESGIICTIRSLRSFKISDESICRELMEQYQLKEDQAIDWLGKI